MALAARALGTRHLVLLGLPGAGKSTIGPLVATGLGRRFVDLDAEIEHREGRSVAAIFTDAGEAYFRAAERALTAELLAPEADPIVLSPGGGWVEDPANRAHLGDGVGAVYLRVSVAVAVYRMGALIGARPLLAGADPGGKLTGLLRRRESFYLQAEYTVSTDTMTPFEVAASIVALASTENRD